MDIPQDVIDFAHRLSEKLTGRYDPEYYSAAHYAVFKCFRRKSTDFGYLTTVIKREVIKAIKANERYETGCSGAFWATYETPTPRTVYSVRGVIAQLKTGRGIAEEYFCGGRTTQEIALLKGLSIGKVRRILAVATRELAEMIRNE